MESECRRFKHDTAMIGKVATLEPETLGDRASWCRNSSRRAERQAVPPFTCGTMPDRRDGCPSGFLEGFLNQKR